MNKRQKQVVQKQLSEEEQELKWLESIYRQAAKDCADRIAELEGRTDLENLQSIIYQKQYQEFLQKQIESTLEDLQKNAYKGISDYLEQCYQTGFIGTQFDLMGQGVPFTFPIDLKAVKRAIETDSKLSKGLYSRLGEDTEYLKKAVKAEISRGIVEGKSWVAVADKLAQHMEQTPFQRAKNNSMRIVRTEGGRIQGQSQLDACREAKEKGADVVKEWDSTLDSKTRETHIELDGQIAEVDEYFVIPSSGKRSLTKGGFNDPAEDCNCRCCVLQRARWALDGKVSKMDNFTKEIREFESPADYEQFKKSFFSDENKTFMKYVDKLENKYDTKDFEKLLDMMSDKEYYRYKDLMKKSPMYDIKKPIFDFDRSLPDIDVSYTVKGVVASKNPMTYKTIKVYDTGEEQGIVTVTKREQLPKGVSSVDSRTYNLNKGEYDVFQYVNGSGERLERERVAANLGGKYLGTHIDYRKYPEQIDFYEVDGHLYFSFGLAKVEAIYSQEALDIISEVLEKRETIILEELKKRGVSPSALKKRKGDDWVSAMKEFHNVIGVDGNPTFIDSNAYNNNGNQMLYRGIAKASNLRKDIKVTMTTKEMAEEFFYGVTPFPSRGIYGDGLAYCSPAKRIADSYAMANGNAKGGAVIQFKLKEGSNVIEYEDAVKLFRYVSKKNNSVLLADANQERTDEEVGKMMAALGFDAIRKPNGDYTGEDFYVILNRGSLEAVEEMMIKIL